MHRYNYPQPFPASHRLKLSSNPTASAYKFHFFTANYACLTSVLHILTFLSFLNPSLCAAQCADQQASTHTTNLDNADTYAGEISIFGVCALARARGAHA